MLSHNAVNTAPHIAALDSGCTHHTLKRSLFPDSVPIDTTQVVDIQTAHSGTSIKSSGRASAGVLKDAIVVEDKIIPISLASLPQFDKAGYETVIKNGKATVSKHGKILFTASLTNRNLYEFDVTPLLSDNEVSALLGSAHVEENLDLWHRRLNHFNKRSICRAVKSNLITGVKITAVNELKDTHCLCDACARAKSTKYPKTRKTNNTIIFSNNNDSDNNKAIFSNTNDSDEFENDESDLDDNSGTNNDLLIHNEPKYSNARDLAIARPLKQHIHLICTDTKGPFRIAGLKGEIYYQSFIEKSTKFLRQYFFTHKSDCFSNLKNLIDFDISAEGSTLHAYQADGAGELISKDIVKYLAERHIKVIYSPPYTARLNATPERNHRTVFEAGHAMLIDSGRPIIFWTYAIRYAGLIFNHFPTNTEFGYMSPAQAKFGLIPNVKNFRRWGCTCYVHIHKEKR